jgi:hypothetical protein
MHTFRLLTLTVIGAVLLAVAGCNDTTGSAGAQPVKPWGASVPTTQVASAAGDHAHKPGAHGGLIVEIGRDGYHAEAVFEKGGKVRLYLLGNDEAKVQEVELQTLTAYSRAEGGTESSEFLLQPDRRENDIDEFVSMAKENPASLREPQDYAKKK